MKAGGNLQKVGKKRVFSDSEENELVNCISVLCNNGFSPSLFEIRECVREYLRLNNKIKSPFKNNRPGRTWMKPFLNRNKLSRKKASMICVSRKSNTANPFVIYHFYEKLVEIFKSHPDLTEEPIWNCDESGFPVDPSKAKVVGPKNQAAYILMALAIKILQH